MTWKPQEPERFPTIQEIQQQIRSKIENFDWETNPKCKQQLYEIEGLVWTYWTRYMQATYNQQTKEFTR